MSVNLLTLIPTDSRGCPSTECDSVIVSAVAEIVPLADDIAVTRFEEVSFVDAGANFERVLCRASGTELSIAWWQDRMEAAHAAQFEELVVLFPPTLTQRPHLRPAARLLAVGCRRPEPGTYGTDRGRAHSPGRDRRPPPSPDMDAPVTTGRLNGDAAPGLQPVRSHRVRLPLRRQQEVQAESGLVRR